MTYSKPVSYYVFYSHHIYLNSESEYIYLIIIHSYFSYDLYLFFIDYNSGKRTYHQVELVPLKENLIVLKRLSNELRYIRQLVHDEGYPVSKVGMISVCGKMSMILSRKEMSKLRAPPTPKVTTNSFGIQHN